MTIAPTLTATHAAYEATPAFQEYWEAMREAERMQGVYAAIKEKYPPGHFMRSDCYRAWRASVHRANDLLKVCRQVPEHRTAFNW